ncbi:MAG: hypothetical protein R3A47_10570 [Polyangiales bacterium]
MIRKKKMHILILAACAFTALGCGDDGSNSAGTGGDDQTGGTGGDDQTGGTGGDVAPRGWSALVKMMDATNSEQLKFRETTPSIALGATTQAKVVVGDAQVESADPSIVSVSNVRTVDVSSSDEDTDYDTYFDLAGVAAGETELIITTSTDGVVRLPIRVRTLDSIEVYNMEADPLTEQQLEDCSAGPLYLLTSALYPLNSMTVRGLNAETGEAVVAKAQWSVSNPAIAAFQVWEPPLTYDVRISFAEGAYVGPETNLLPKSDGDLIVNVQMAGVSTTVPVHVALVQPNNCDELLLRGEDYGLASEE